MRFADVIGQEKIKKNLISLVKENRLSHALLLFGPEGCGKLALAIAFAQYINCENKTETDSCGVCNPCKKISKLIHPDVHFTFPVNTTQTSGSSPVSDDFISPWREFVINNPYFSENTWYEYIGIENKQGIISKNESYEIIKKLNLKTFEAEYKIMIVWLPEKMNMASGNKLLKLIEEPPEKTLFLFISENTAPILPTILSRLQLIKLSKIQHSEIAKALIDKYSITEKDADNIAKIADGNFKNAVEIYESKGEGKYNLELFIKLMRLCYANNVVEINEFVEEISGIGREKQKNFLSYGLRILRENFMMNQKLEKLTHLDEPEFDFSKKFSAFINKENIYQIYKEFNDAHYHIEANAYNKIVFFDLALKLMKLIKK